MAVTLARMGWDMGPVTVAQARGKVVEPVMFVDPDTGRASNPNGVMRSRRMTWLDRYAAKGKINAGQLAVARELIEAHEGRPARDVMGALVVDGGGHGLTPEEARFEARRKFHRMWAALPIWARPVTDHVVIRDCSLRSMAGRLNGRSDVVHLDRLVRGLDALRDGCRLWLPTSAGARNA